MQRFDKDGNDHLSPDEMVELRAALQKSASPIAFPYLVILVSLKA